MDIKNENTIFIDFWKVESVLNNIKSKNIYRIL